MNFLPLNLAVSSAPSSSSKSFHFCSPTPPPSAPGAPPAPSAPLAASAPQGSTSFSDFEDSSFVWLWPPKPVFAAAAAAGVVRAALSPPSADGCGGEAEAEVEGEGLGRK